MNHFNLRTMSGWLVLSLLAVPHAHAQRQVQKLLASNGATGDGFGASCSIAGEWCLASAAGSNFLALGAGAVYSLRLTNGAWTETQILLASTGQNGDLFGWSLAMSGNFAVVGALGSAGFTSVRCGAAYVFERVGTTWIERQKLVPSIPFNDGQFGNAVAISGDRIVVGSWFSSLAGANSGAAYIYERSGSTWNQVAVLQPPGLSSGDAFGTAVALEGDVCVVSSFFDFGFQGSVAVYKRNVLGVWQYQQTLVGSNVPAPGYFGGNLALSGTTIMAASGNQAVGSVLEAGAVHVFESVAGIWSETQVFSSNDIESYDGFSVRSLRGDVAICSSVGDNDGGHHSGASFVFRRLNGSWIQSAKVLANDPQFEHNFGSWADISGETLVVGAVGDDDVCGGVSTCNAGAVYFFDLAPTAIQYGSCASGAPCGNSDNHGGCSNSTGQGAVLQASGSGSVATDDLTLEVRNMPPGAAALMFMGGAQSSILLGSGRLVVGGGSVGLYRLGVQFAGANGVVVRPAGLVAYSQTLGGLGVITAGQTWNFQCWYRDVISPCGITNNLSNGLSVGFVP
jgi:hypothetical protein